MLTILLIAVGLAMDAFAVSIAKGMAIGHNRRRTALLLASFFGGFQMLMPALGWFAGQSLRETIMGVDHWIAFGLLALIGAKMIYDSSKTESGEQTLQLHSLLTLAVATSIDALMVGLSLSFLQTSLMEPILMIGSITFMLSVLGFYFGCGLGRYLGNKIRVIGGLILIGIGIRILLEHLL